MNAMRHAVFLAALLGTVLAAGAADRMGPEPSDVIHPRVSDASASSNEIKAEQIVPAPAVGGMLPALGYLLVFGGIAGGVWYFLKMGTLARPFHKSEGKLQVLETKGLGNRQFLVVAEYEDAKMLLAVCPGRIDYLTPLAGHPLAGSMSDDRDEVELPRELAATLEGIR
jgi:flagellar biogenesis protein FliO